MSRSGYSDDIDQWDLIRWRGAVASAIRGERGQAFLREMAIALDAMEVKELVRGELQVPGESKVCAIGSVGVMRGINMDHIDPEDREGVAHTFNIAPALASEVVYVNDDYDGYDPKVTPAERWSRMRNWVERQLHGAAGR